MQTVNNTLYTFLMILVVAAVTAILRFLPFFVFDGKRTVPKLVQSLGAVLPYSVMAMLVVYCLKDISFGQIQQWLPSAISVAVVVILHVLKRNTLLSIIGGTVCYMLLIRVLL